ncbi:MAG: FAD-binding oxidoreductase, partial [Rhodospirillaceae bacterium]|nr:FAD-binding oxidoreductase [Rhodospirillaceae bacterium]
LGGEICTDSRALSISRDDESYVVKTKSGEFSTGRVVLAAGLGNRDLASMVDLEQPVRPVKGQIMVSERVQPFLDIPTTHVRQTNEGTVMIGDSHEEVGYDLSSTPRVAREIADRARRSFPFLNRVRIVRTWAALRVMTPDGLPIYDQSETMPGVFSASCHSGVTLAATHAFVYAPYVADGKIGDELAALSARRFDV